MDNILEYENLIYKMISQYKSFDKEDLYQVAMIGLMKAKKNYKDSENTKFSTYAYYYILGEINNYITASNPVKVSRDLLRLNKSLEQAKEVMRQRLRREPTSEELSIFLEEPLDNTYAFLLTENEFAILPTIISRVQIIHFSTINQNILLKETEEAGISSDIAELLSFFYNSAESIIEKANDHQTIKVIETSSATIKNIKDKRKLYDVIFNNVLKVCTSKVTTRQYFDYLTVFFKEALKVKNKQDTILKSYDNILKDLANFSNIEGSILKLMHSRNEINFNLNNNLLIIHTFRNIFGDI